jgi:DNA topoisomerase-1
MQASRQDAQKAHLRYISDETVPGISRHGRPGRFTYRYPSGKPVRDAATLRRIAKLAIPPAWTDVWIAPVSNAHLAATGRDVKRRKQYRYHPGFAAVRDRNKYAHLVEFAHCLPRLRQHLKSDLAKAGLPREKILAAVAALLDETLIRVGNERYARDNHSFGLTTLRNRHVTVEGATLHFMFKGKSGKSWELSLQDRRVAKVVRECQELPGQHLFEYRADGNTVHAVTSDDINRYLRAITGKDISAKDFRTWRGTVAALEAFGGTKGPPSRKAVKAVIAQVAKLLGNTVAVCRKCYIHPAIIAGFESGNLPQIKKTRTRGLSAAEHTVLRYLEGCA